jgi:hypothetical protein
MDELTGRIIGGRYRVEAFEGHGGMANVYKVWDLQRAAYLAMKVLHADLAEDRVFLRRFKREGLMLERLQHPNIVRFYGLEESEGLAYILMDYIEGLTLRREIYLNKNGMRPARVLQIMQPVCAALHYAHLLGMVHCDIKPVNIIIHRNGTVFLADFGIARVTGARTQTALVSGTPAYMAPEQSQGEEASPASDIYALGVVLFEMLTGGERPFSGESVVGQGRTTQRIIWEKSNLDPPPPSRFNRRISPELEAVTLHCLEREPNLRFASTLELSAALDQAVHGAGGNYDISTLVDIYTPPRDGAGQVFAPDEEEVGPAADELPAADDRPAAEDLWAAHNLPPGTYLHPWNEQPEAGSLPGEHAEQASRVPADWVGETGAADRALFEETPAPLPTAAPEEPPGSPALALVLAQPAESADEPRGAPRRLRLPRLWLLAGIGLAALLAIGLLLSNGRPDPAVPPVSAAATREASVLPLGEPLPTRTVTATATLPAPTSTRAARTPIPTGTPLPQPTVLGGGRGRIAFASDRSGSVQIWVMDAGNLERREQVTSLPGGACQPAWSPDGARIAFITPCNGPRLTYPGAEIMIVDLETGALSDLNLPGSAFDPAWSPDGERLAYTTYIGDKTVIYAVSLAERKPYPLVTSGRKNEDPDWSPDGEMVVYISDNKGIDEIWVIDRDGGSKEMVTEAGLFKYFSGPKWGPDGRSIIAMMKELNQPAPIPVLVLIDRYAGREGGAPLLNETMRMEDGSFSADGQWLVFWTVVDGRNMEILRASLDGQVERLTDHTARDFHPAWGWR